MSEDLISVIDVAKQHSKHKAAIFKILKRLGIEAQKLRGPDSRGQLASYITQEECNLVIAELEASQEFASDPSEIISPEAGVFYVMQLEPDHDPGRIKVGFTSNIAERLRKHRTSAPYTTVLKTWACRSLWENTAIDCICEGCEKLTKEVFRTSSIDIVIAKGDEFFAIMPQLHNGDESD